MCEEGAATGSEENRVSNALGLRDALGCGSIGGYSDGRVKEVGEGKREEFNSYLGSDAQ